MSMRKRGPVEGVRLLKRFDREEAVRMNGRKSMETGTEMETGAGTREGTVSVRLGGGDDGGR